jgi:formate-dependent nitrite reductase membrane component NrfD
VTSGSPDGWSNSSAAALLSYDVPHRAPWDWRVSLYTWTKAIAAGAYLVPLLLILAGLLSWSSVLWTWAAPIVALAGLALTGALLIWDLEHPERFHLIFTRPQWRSWLVRGAFVIVGFGAVVSAHLLASLLDRPAWQRWLAVAGLPLSVLTAVYTAWLFAKSKGRDLWQSPLLPPHIAVQAVLAGSAATLLVAEAIGRGPREELAWLLAGSVLAHLLLAAGEVLMPHPTAHARLAAWEMWRGRYRSFFWTGVVLTAVALLAPAIGWVAAPLALGGLLAHEHAYVQAAQAVPLA